MEKNRIKGKKSHDDDMAKPKATTTAQKTEAYDCDADEKNNNNDQDVLILLTNLIKAESAIISCRLGKCLCFITSSKCTLPFAGALVSMCFLSLLFDNCSVYIYIALARLIVVCQPLFHSENVTWPYIFISHRHAVAMPSSLLELLYFGKLFNQ